MFFFTISEKLIYDLGLAFRLAAGRNYNHRLSDCKCHADNTLTSDSGNWFLKVSWFGLAKITFFCTDCYPQIDKFF